MRRKAVENDAKDGRVAAADLDEQHDGAVVVVLALAERAFVADEERARPRVQHFIGVPG